MSDESANEPPVIRGEGGRFLKGTKGGPGRQRRRPLRDVVTFEVEADLWRAHLDEALGGEEGARNAREFVLRHVAGTPYQACPEIPPLAWPAVLTVDDLAAAVGTILTAHSEGQIDSAGLTHLVDLLGKLAKVFEAVEMAPKLRKLEEYVQQLGATA